MNNADEWDQLCEMFDLQRRYDDLVFSTRCGGQHPSLDDILLALFDELGEVNHALKGNWCWWKQTQSPVDREEVLEEIVDVLHFVLCYIIEASHIYQAEPFDRFVYPNRALNERIFSKDDTVPLDSLYFDLIQTMREVPNRQLFIIRSYMNIPRRLGYSFQEVYEAYKKKNAINIQRMKEGY